MVTKYFVFLAARHNWTFKMRLKIQKKEGYFSNLKVAVWFSIFQKNFTKLIKYSESWVDRIRQIFRQISLVTPSSGGKFSLKIEYFSKIVKAAAFLSPLKLSKLGKFHNHLIIFGQFKGSAVKNVPKSDF